MTSDTPGRLVVSTAGTARKVQFAISKPAAPLIRCQQQAFDQQHLEQPVARRAEGDAHADLALARHGAAEEQVGHVGAGDQQDEPTAPSRMSSGRRTSPDDLVDQQSRRSAP